MKKRVGEYLCALEQGKESGRRRGYYLLYTAAFALLAALVFCHFIRNGKSFVYSDDGWKQHYKALVYYAEWLRTIVRNLWENHELVIPQFSFSIGYGADIVTTLHYYAIGDPLNLFSALVPREYMVHFYGFLIILRLYLAGAAFSAYCFYRKKYGWISVMAGAFSYAFCGFALTGATMHPYFANPMIYFPLLLLGVEKVWREKKPWVLIGIVFISAISNFYFFYMLVLMVVLYVLVRVCIPFPKKQVRQAAGKIFQVGMYSLLGVALSAFLFLPVIALFFDNPRSSYSSTWRVFYRRWYYERFLAGFVDSGTIGHWNYMGYTALVLLAVFVLFLCRKKYAELKAGFLLLTGLLCFPLAGFVMNGCSYVSNRWIWAYSMLVSYILTAMWEEMKLLTRKKAVLVGIAGIVYYVIGSSLRVGKMICGIRLAFLIFVPAFVILLLFARVRDRKKEKCLELALLALVVVNVTGTAYYKFAPSRSTALKSFLDTDQVALTGSEAKVMEKVENSGEFYRYSGDIYSNANANSTMISGLSGVQFYWSLSNSAMAPFMEQLSLRENSAYNYKTLDNRTALSTLSSVKYHICRSEEEGGNYAPYGFAPYPIEGRLGDKYSVYKNEYALSLGYAYQTYILPETYEKLSPVEKQEALLQGILLEERPEGFEATEPELTSQELEYAVTCIGDQVTQQGNSFVVTEKDAQITLNFQGLKNSETYLYLTGLQYQGVSPMRLYSDDTAVDPLNLYTLDTLPEEEKKEIEYSDEYWQEPAETVLRITSVNEKKETTLKKLNFRTRRYSWYAGRHSFAVNMCYDESAKQSITITFPERGIYSFDSIKVICQPMDNYEAQITALGQDVLENVDLHNQNAVFATNQVTGTIALEEDRILCLTVPYSKGWKAYVDGEERQLLQANTIYMALPLSAGEHEIRLEYQTPWSTAGIWISLAGAVCLLGLIILRKEQKCFQ